VKVVKPFRRTMLSLGVLVSMLAAPLVALNAGGSSWAAGGPTTPQNQLVSAVPAAGTPNVVDGEVLTFAQVGTTMVAGGTFTQVQNSAGTTTYARPHIVAFDATTGAVNTAFAPNLNGEVDALLAGPVPGTVYVGGLFSTDNGAAVPNLVLLNVSDGSRVAGFAPGAMSKGVMTVRLVGSQLVIGGNFTSVGGTARGGLASLNPSTGAVTSFLATSVTGHHNFGHVSAAELAAINFPGIHVAEGNTGVARIAINPQGTRMVVIGNFDTVGGLARDQIAVFNLSATAATIDPNWKTTRFSDACFWFTFDSWIRDVDFSPDGTYFAVAAAGGHDVLLPEAATTCDTITRWETSASGQNLQPTWMASSGSDSFFSVAVTGPAVYGAGHPRWLNNPLASDNKGGGAVARPGIVALDPVNGLPYTWNPGREPRGHGTQGMLATAAGLWIGSDTDWIGNQQYKRRKIAFFPLAGGASPASTAVTPLPADVYLGQPASLPGTGLALRPYDGTHTGVTTPVASPIDWTSVRAATLIGGNLFYGKTTTAMLFSRTFDGTSFGPEVAVNPYSIPYWDNVVDAGRGTNGNLTLQGVQPDLYAQLPSLTSMAYDPSTGRLYYTRAGDPALYYRAFTPDSGVVFPVAATMSGVSMAQTSGMFVSGSQLYFANGVTGTLSAVTLGGTAVAGPATVVSGPGVDGTSWASGAMFAGPLTAPVLTGPTAAFTSSCTLLACSFDATGSTDPGAAITSYAWDYGDGSTDTGVAPSHTFAAAGPQTVTLTVTDDQAQTSTVTHTFTVSSVGHTIAFVGSAQATANASTETVTIPPTVAAGNALVLVASSASATPQTAPAGWAQVASVPAGTSVATTVWSKVATASDAGSTVTVAYGGLHKGSLQLLAYSGTSLASPVAAVATASGSAASTSETAPAVAVAGSAGWVVSLWEAKSSTVSAFTAPAGASVRSTAIGSPSGQVSALAADSGGPVSTGTYAGQTAGMNGSATWATTVSLVLSAA
jgi:PKD repeat protein